MPRQSEKKAQIAARKKAYQAELDAQVAAKAAKKEEAKRAVLAEMREDMPGGGDPPQVLTRRR